MKQASISEQIKIENNNYSTNVHMFDRLSTSDIPNYIFGILWWYKVCVILKFT